MKTAGYYMLSVVCAIIGSGYYCYRQGWIVVSYPRSVMVVESTAHYKKNNTLWACKGGTWRSEVVTVLWSSDTAVNSFLLLNRWLTFAEDEGLIKGIIALQTAILSPTGSTLYLSFDRTLFSRHEATKAKWLLIESLLKTVRENLPSVEEVCFLVDHQPLLDSHIDCSKAWPVNGFYGL